ncbi:radical SAM protein [Candidatus Parcubacteria bacterium]|jgi:MoaA/NifB/PqqE/SkfB family radical SAM enzyme|nr:radical SAM protein [Candidatus Parcubacteria bacterium]
MSIFSKFRFKWFISTRSIQYSIDFFERVYKIYLNHNKVVHWRDGYPVYSLSTPAVYSKPAVNLFSRSVFSTIQNRNFPNLMSFAVNDTCNVNCEHCSFFESADDRSRQILTLDQSKKLIEDAQELGVSVINIVGGEPLLRDDLPEIVSSIDKDLSIAILFTNGWFLEEKAEQLKQSGLDGVYISMDSANREEHDKRRRKDGLFDKALAGIQAAKKAGLTVGLSCTISEDDFRSGRLKAIIELGQELGVHEVLVFDMVPVGRAKSRDDLIDNRAWIEEMITFSKKYNKDKSYPGVLIYAYATSYRSTGCSGGTSYFYASPYGDISPCDFNHAGFGNILQKPLYKIWDELSTHPHFSQATWQGCKMKDSEFLNASDKKQSGCSGCSCEH